MKRSRHPFKNEYNRAWIDAVVEQVYDHPMVALSAHRRFTPHACAVCDVQATNYICYETPNITPLHLCASCAKIGCEMVGSDTSRA